MYHAQFQHTEVQDLQYFAVEDAYGRTHIFNQHTNPKHFDFLRQGRGYQIADGVPPAAAEAAMSKWSQQYEQATLHWKDGRWYGNCNDYSAKQLLQAAADVRVSSASRDIAAEHAEAAGFYSTAAESLESRPFLIKSCPTSLEGGEYSLEQVSQQYMLQEHFKSRGLDPAATIAHQDSQYAAILRGEAALREAVDVPIGGEPPDYVFARPDSSLSQLELARSVQLDHLSYAAREYGADPGYVHDEWVNLYALQNWVEASKTMITYKDGTTSLLTKDQVPELMRVQQMVRKNEISLTGEQAQKLDRWSMNEFKCAHDQLSKLYPDKIIGIGYSGIILTDSRSSARLQTVKDLHSIREMYTSPEHEQKIEHLSARQSTGRYLKRSHLKQPITKDTQTH
jgi:hypothetical protein